jgi:HSP20 family protein
MTNLMRSDPMVDIERFDPFRRFEDIFGGRRLRSMLRDWTEIPAMRMDITEDEKAYHVKAELPGVNKDDIHVSIEANVVSITAELKADTEKKTEGKGGTVLCSERVMGSQSRSFTLRHDIDQKRAEAKCVDGVLELTLPKMSNGAVRELTVQ